MMRIGKRVNGECSIFKKNYIMDENDSLSEYNTIPLGRNRTNGAVYSKIYFKVFVTYCNYKNKMPI